MLHTPQGLPEDAKESDLAALFEPVGGIREIRLPREPGSQHCKGFAFLVRHSRVAVLSCVGVWPCAVWIRQVMLADEPGRHSPSWTATACLLADVAFRWHAPSDFHRCLPMCVPMSTCCRSLSRWMQPLR